MKLKIRKAFDRDRSQLEFHNQEGELLEPCTVEQHHTDDTLIQNILKRYDKTGVFYHVNQAQATYQDNTPFNEYADMYNKVEAAKANFLKIPSDIRERFNNDPGQFLEFVNNDQNVDEMIEMGLMPRPEPEPAPVVETPAPEVQTEE